MVCHGRLDPFRCPAFHGSCDRFEIRPGPTQKSPLGLRGSVSLVAATQALRVFLDVALFAGGENTRVGDQRFTAASAGLTSGDRLGGLSDERFNRGHLVEKQCAAVERLIDGDVDGR